MVQEEHRISSDGGEAMQESLQNKASTHRSLGIKEPEKLWKEESERRFSRDTEPGFHSLCPHPNTTAPFIPWFDPSSPFRYYVENFPMFWSQLLYSSPPVSSDGTMPLLWTSFQRETYSSCFNMQLSLVPSELMSPPWEPQLLLPLQEHDLQQQISQVMNHSSLHSDHGAGLRLELELSSIQSRYGTMNALFCPDQQIVVMNHPWHFQMAVAQNQGVTVVEPIPISCFNCGTMPINGTQGRNADWPMNGASEEYVAALIERRNFSLESFPSVCSNTRSPKSMPMRRATKRQLKKTEESSGSKASATPSEPQVFYNFMELPYNDYIAERDMVANKKRRLEGSDAVDVELKL